MDVIDKITRHATQYIIWQLYNFNNRNCPYNKLIISGFVIVYDISIQALSLTQMRDERPPLPPKAAPPVPPPRRHKVAIFFKNNIVGERWKKSIETLILQMSGDRMSASPRPPSVTEQRNSFHGSQPVVHTQTMPLNNRMASPHGQKIPAHLQKLAAPGHLGSMPYLPSGAHHPSAPVAQAQANTLGHLNAGWGRPRNSLPGFNVPPNMMQVKNTVNILIRK